MNILLRRAIVPAVPIYPKDRRDYLTTIERADADHGGEFVKLVVRLELETIDQLLSESS